MDIKFISEYWICSSPKIGSKRLMSLLSAIDWNTLFLFQHPNDVDYKSCGIPPDAAKLLISRANPEFIEKELNMLHSRKIIPIPFTDVRYPSLLKEIHLPPKLLYTMGRIELLSDKLFAIVGTRQCTSNGAKNTYNIAKDLSASGVSIISGLARGIDTYAHTGAIEGGTPTAAIIGCGLDIIYPPENEKLYFKIAETGVIISEYPLGTPPLAQHFAPRNRIISGMSYGVLLTQGRMKSGGNITVSIALQENRDVFALPGDISLPQSELPNNLIREGAQIVLGADTILNEYGWGKSYKAKPSVTKHNLDPFLKSILEFICDTERTLDEITIHCNKPVNEVGSAITELELLGVISRLPGNRFSLNNL